MPYFLEKSKFLAILEVKNDANNNYYFHPLSMIKIYSYSFIFSISHIDIYMNIYTIRINNIWIID